MKETEEEEELYEKCFQEIINRKLTANWTRKDHIAVALLFHQTMLESSLPSEQEMDELSKNYSLFEERCFGFRAGMKYLINRIRLNEDKTL